MIGRVLRALRDLGPRTTWDVGMNTVRTAWADRRTRARRAPAGTTARTPGPLVAIEPLTLDGVVIGARCRFAEVELELAFVGDAMVRVSWGPDEPPVRATQWAEGHAVGVTVAGTTVGTSALSVHVGTDGALRYTATGVVVRHESAPIRRGRRRSLRWPLRPGERMVGLGEQARELAGFAHRLWNTDPVRPWSPGDDPLYCVIPVLLGVHHEATVLTFFDNAHDGRVAIGPAGVDVAFEDGMLRHYVTAGTLAAVVARYVALTGLPPMPPRWALGYHQSRWGYRDEHDVRAISEGFAAERLALSAVHLDIDHMDGYRVFSVDPVRFPDLAGLTRELAARGTRAVAIVDPAVKVDPDYDVFTSGTGLYVHDGAGRPVRGAVWPGTAVFPDFTNPATRDWWAGLYPRLLDRGIAGIWHDMNEPTSLAFANDRTLPLDARHDMEGRGGDHRDAHNLYGLLMDRAGAEGLRRHRPDRRPFVLSRSGWAGLQAWAWLWTGDTTSTWPSMRQQIATVVNLGLSGLAFSGPDIGGFSGDPGPELYVRWLEMAVFMPLCRTHCVTSAPRREPWAFPEPYRSAIGRLIRLRYRLLPYLYTLAHEASTTGHPLVRPAGWPASTGTPDCFLLGDALLVAPVTGPGRRRRRVVLPEGQWVPWQPCGDREPGPAMSGQVEIDSPLGTPAVLVRAGTIVPLDEGWSAEGDGQLELDHRPRALSFHVVPDAEGRAVGRYYDDAGDGDGPWRLEQLMFADGALQRHGAGEWPEVPAAAVNLR